MAEVFIARRIGAHGFTRRVALKTILPQFASDPEFAAMFIDEARIAARLEHPAIGQVFDFGDADGTLFLAMEFVDGASVNRVLRASPEHEPFPLAATLHIGIEAARALAYAHHARDDGDEALGVVHRDVSPANILLGRRGEVKLVDFGIARCATSKHRTEDGLVRGKLGYMSPEQVAGQPLDGRSDVFTLATVLAETILGEPLFGQGQELDVLLRIRHVDLSRLDQSKGRVPAELVQLLRRALAPTAEERIPASVFADALEQIAERRGLLGKGPREVARLLHRLALVHADRTDIDAREPGARPTAWVDTGVTEQLKLEAAGGAELLATLALEAPAHYEVKMPDGRALGPMPYADLVRRIVSGEVTPDAKISRDGDPSKGEPPELKRYLTSPALGWSESSRKADVNGPRGTIREGALLSVMHELTARKVTGRLELFETGDRARRKRVFFVDGRPEFVASNDPGELFGEFLVKNDLCLKMEVDMALAVLDRYQGRLGDALIGLGIFRPVELARLVARQVRERYLEAFRWRRGEWAFFHGARIEEAIYALGDGPIELLRDAALATDAQVAEAALSPLRERIVEKASQPPTPLRAFSVPRAWERALDEADGRTTLSSLIMRTTRDGHLELDEAYRAFHFGLSCAILRSVTIHAP